MKERTVTPQAYELAAIALANDPQALHGNGALSEWELAPLDPEDVWARIKHCEIPQDFYPFKFADDGLGEVSSRHLVVKGPFALWGYRVTVSDCFSSTVLGYTKDLTAALAMALIYRGESRGWGEMKPLLNTFFGSND